MHRLAGLIRAFLVSLLLALPGLAAAADYTDRAALDELFAQLRVAPTAADAEAISQQIWSLWLTPDVPELADRMGRANAAMSSGDLSTALSVLSGIVTDYPDYAEGWNQRATLYYIMNDYPDSLSDIDKVLALEPRHFGALSGRVMIYLREGKRDAALRDMVAALAIHPFLTGRQLFPELGANVTHV